MATALGAWGREEVKKEPQRRWCRGLGPPEAAGVLGNAGAGYSG